MIASGEKKEEYREIKPYWINRLSLNIEYSKFKGFEVVCFKNGYSKNAPTIIVDFNGIEIREGHQEWGAEPGKKYFVIKLGKQIS